MQIMNAILQEQTINKLIGAEADKLDIKSLIDNTCGLDENLTHIKQKYPDLFKEETYKKDYIQFLEKQQNEIEENYNKAQMQNEIEEIKNTKQTEFLDEKFKVLNSLILTLTKSKEISSLIVEGGQGIGKSFTITRTLAKQEVSFFTITGHITSLQFYNLLYKHRKDTIVIDDNGTLLKNDASLSLLLNALWGLNGKRIISWFSSSGHLTAPSTFQFDGKLIFLTNKFPEKLENLKSRVFFYRFNLSYDDKIKMLYEIAKIKEIDTEICDYIKENCNIENNIDIRTMIKINDIKQTSENWREIAKEILEIDENMFIIRSLLLDYSVSEAQAEFTKQTGLSRRTFFYYKKKLS